MKLIKPKNIIIGSANFGLNYGISNNYKKISSEQIKKIINFCEKKNINFIDTAAGYGNSEEIIGSITNKKWKIITKLPLLKSNNYSKLKKDIFDYVYLSLLKLKKNNIYGILLHEEKQLLFKNGIYIYKILKELKKKKIIKYFGVSFYSRDILINTIKNYKLDIVQIPMNYINNEFHDIKTLKKIKNKVKKIHVRSVFHQGLLLNPKIKSNKIRKYKKYIQYLKQWHFNKKYSHIESALNFFKSYKYIDAFVIGINSSEDLIEILNCKKRKIHEFPKINDKKFVDLRNI